MARIPREIVEAVRERTDLVEVVGRHVKLQKRGGSYLGLCPFHQEKTPSFHVVPHKQFFHCFGCQASGDAFKFLMEIEGLSFTEAVRELAGPAGVEIQTEALSQDERDRLRKRASLYDVLAEAQKLYTSILMTRPEGQVARDYLSRRGITPETIEAWGLGWAPEGWQTLLDHLREQRIGADLAIEAGLARRRERGDGAYDAFRARVIIPIRDERGRVIAMGGRLLEGDGPKYINSPETPLYRKSAVLFGLDAARRAIERKGRALLVEGYFDVISLHQAGFDEAIATCGTALTGDHAERLRRLCREVLVVTDADEAGMRAAERSLPLLEKAHVVSRRLQVPGAKDPDELVREQGAEAFEVLIDEARSLLGWVAGRKLKAHGYSAAGKEAARDEITELLGGLTAVQATELAPILRIPEGELLAWTRAHGRRAPQTGGPTHEPDPRDAAPRGWRPTREAVHLLWLAVHRLDEAGETLRRVPPDLIDPAIVPALARLMDGESPPAILDDIDDPGVRRTLSAVVARDRLYAPPEAAPAVAEITGVLAKQRVEGALAQAQDAAVQALRAGDQEAGAKALARKRALEEGRRDLEQERQALAHARRQASTGRADAQQLVHEALDGVLAAAGDLLDHLDTGRDVS